MLSTASLNKKTGNAKGNLTKVINQTDTQDSIAPGRRDESTILHLHDLLQRAEASYAEAYESVVDVYPDNPAKQKEEESHYDEFVIMAGQTRARLNAMLEQRKAYHLIDTLVEDITYWEDCPIEDLRASFPGEYPAVMKRVNECRKSACTTGATSITELKAHVNELKRKIMRLEQKSRPPPTEPSASSVASSSSSHEDYYRHDMKARAVPLPIFKGNLADWRTFWTRFNEYVGKIRHITDHEKLCYLQDAVKDPTALDIVSDAARNGDSFAAVGDRLTFKFDQPREVYTEALRGLMSVPAIEYTKQGVSNLARDLNRYQNILERYGDGTASQVFTAIMETRMSPRLLEEWRLYNSSPSVPSAAKLVEFCDKRELILSPSEEDHRKGFKPPTKQPPKNISTSSQKRNGRAPSSSLHVSAQPMCRHCQSGDHSLYQCTSFRDLDITERQRVVQNLQACFNCLGLGHNSKNCVSKRNCKECGRRHHTLLHQSTVSCVLATPSAPAVPAASMTNADPESSLTAGVPSQTALVLSCQVTLDANGKQQSVRAMIDTGSTLSFVTGKVVAALSAKKVPFATTVSGLESSHAASSHFKVDLVLRSITDEQEPPVPISPSVVKSITRNTPVADITRREDVVFTRNLKLADPHFGQPGNIDLLIGQDALAKVLRGGMVSSRNSTLYAINTMFGWVVGGRCETPAQAVTAHICCKATVDSRTDELLKAFWEAEEPPTKGPSLSPEEQSALEHFRDHTTHGPDGRYCVRLPRREDAPTLGHSRMQAIRRYEQNARSLKKKGKWEDFERAVSEYADLGHAERVPVAQLLKQDERVYYMPMHGVVKEASTSTKLRVVFDASAKTSTGSSLNDVLLPGPTLYPLLSDILLRFRDHPIGMTADISKMFREVSLHPDDRDLHRYVTKNKEGQIEDWRMSRVTFGVTSSPFLATQVLRQLAEDYREEYPEAAHLIETSFYVDDCLTGASTHQEAQHLRESLCELMTKASMTLRKWRSNSSELKATIPDVLLEKEERQLISSPLSCHKALGVHWDTEADTLHVATPTLDENAEPTKRQVLSDIARTFDVIGWFAPVTVSLKVLLQKIWHLGLEWDQTIPPELAESWTSWRTELPEVTEFPIPRYYHHSGKRVRNIQLHGFCDASQVAYAGAVYLRTTYEDTTMSTALVIAKSRVAPVKTTTIPKLELCSAVLLVKLVTAVRKALNIDLSDTFTWSDSTIALGWIQTSPHLLKTYVANRVVAITEAVPLQYWRHVPSAENPADLGSRGCSATILTSSTLWWSGPAWLSQGPDTWPSQEWQRSTLPELKSVTLVALSAPSTLDIVSRYSNYNTLTNVMAWLLRFIANARKKPDDRNLLSYVTVSEVQAAETLIHLHHQSLHWSAEIAALRAKKSVSGTSPLSSYTPFLDQDGVLRVGGRLSESDLPYDQKHPVILSRKDPLVRLLVEHLHKRHLHAGPTLLMAALSRGYYVMGARRLVRDVTKKCITCRRAYARTGHQLMADLPSVRVRPAPAFSRVGIDFAGPITLRQGHTRRPIKVKAYISLFVCLTVKAVHLELVSDLSTEAFLMAFRRFVARRGRPSEVHTDNGTNFVGGERELQELQRLLTKKSSQQAICHYFTEQRITWHFIPGRAPHFGGLWEAAVKSAKTLLRKLLGTHCLTTEEYASVLTEVEAVLNSRPLCQLQSLPEDCMEVLTPGHFLVGRPLTALPQQSLEILSRPSRKRWNLCQRLSCEFWLRWKEEYLQTLQQRHKWEREERNVSVGDVVLIRDQELFTRTWPLAIVTAIHPGTDGRVRAATLRTSKGIYTRPIVKIVPLLEQEEPPSPEGGGCSGL